MLESPSPRADAVPDDARADGRPRTARPPTPDTPRPDGAVSVVVADDSDRFRLGIVRALQQTEGLQVLASVADGYDALRSARALLPDVLVVDDRMPGLCGTDVALSVNRDGRLLHVRVVLLTANACPELSVRARRAGAVGTIDKALSRTDIVTAIRNAAR